MINTNFNIISIGNYALGQINEGESVGCGFLCVLDSKWSLEFERHRGKGY